MEDNLILFLTLFSFLGTLYFVKLKRIGKLINLFIFIFYTSLLFMKWSFSTDPSSSLGYLFFIIFFVILHLIILIFQVIIPKKKS
jgi:4-hydroxybenzoate polyprenyltransferase